MAALVGRSRPAWLRPPAAWLDVLDTGQRRTATGAVLADDATDVERRRWFYTATDHGGLTFHEQRPAQQRAAMRLVATGLSTPAYVTVATVVGLENLLDHAEGFRVLSPGNAPRPGLYYLRVFGEPGGPGPWGCRFGGHDVSLNNRVVDGELISTTPCFLGADPATSPVLGGAVNRPLARVEDLARDLVRSLPAGLAQRAVLLSHAPSDIVTANRSRVSEGDRVIPLSGVWRDERFPDPGEQAKLESLSDAIDEAAGYSDDDHRAVARTKAPKGVTAAELDGEQRELLRALLGTYLDRVPPEVSPRALCDKDALLDAVYVAWARPVEPGAPHYYRVQGPQLPPRVGQHPARRQPRALGLARPGCRLRARRAGPAPRRAPLAPAGAAPSPARLCTGAGRARDVAAQSPAGPCS